LTTAFCLLAIHAYNTQREKEKLPLPIRKDAQKNLILSHITKTVTQRFSLLPKDLKETALSILQKTLKKDVNGNRTLLPYYYYRSLKQNSAIDTPFLIRLGEASLYGWIAYTIYDDFLDEEGNPAELPLANVCLRELTAIFLSISDNPTFIRLFPSLMDTLEGANTWEVTHCRCPVRNTILHLESFTVPLWKTYDKLAERSYGIMLGPIAISLRADKKIDTQKIGALRAYFKHYIIAKQLNDDAHDWEKDLRKGHVTPVVAHLLTAANIHEPIRASLLISRLNQQFWETEIVRICTDIVHHTTLAHRALARISAIGDTAFLERLLKQQRESADRALSEHISAQEFLQAYQHPENAGR
jgi:hypothetical protein